MVTTEQRHGRAFVGAIHGASSWGGTILVLASALFAACGTQNDNRGGGSGGHPAAGADGGGRGGDALGGHPVGGGGGGAGGVSFGGGGEGGANVDNPLCPSGPVTTWDEPRHIFPWLFVAVPDDGAPGTAPDGYGGTASGAAGAGGGGGVAGGSGASRCTKVPDAVVGYDVHCTGPAWLQSRATGVVVLLDDGSLFAWDSNGLAAAVYPPYVEQQDGQGDRIWMSFEQRDVLAAGAFAGTFRTQSLVIRDGEGGRIRFLARQGAIVPDLAPTDIYDLFGVGATSQPACTRSLSDNCHYTFQRTYVDHLLGTMPPQLIPSAQYTEVTSPNGDFTVVWSASTETDFQPIPGLCADGPAIASDTGIVATLQQPRVP